MKPSHCIHARAVRAGTLRTASGIRPRGRQRRPMYKHAVIVTPDMGDGCGEGRYVCSIVRMRLRAGIAYTTVFASAIAT